LQILSLPCQHLPLLPCSHVDVVTCYTSVSLADVALLCWPCRKKKKEKKPKQDAYLAGVSDRKLKGQLKHTERLYKQSNKAAAHINQWLAPADAGFVEAEGEARLPGCHQQQQQQQHASNSSSGSQDAGQQ
jgi:hypothetical protein